MDKSKYSITFACYNSVEYTKMCIDSMIKHSTPLDRLVVVDNFSNDETRDYLSTLPIGGKIFNTAFGRVQRRPGATTIGIANYAVNITGVAKFFGRKRDLKKGGNDW